MSFLRSKFNSVFCRTRAISPYCVEFCEREIHDPLFDCCYGVDLTGRATECFSDCAIRTKKPAFSKAYTIGGSTATATVSGISRGKSKKRKLRGKRPKSASVFTSVLTEATGGTSPVHYHENRRHIESNCTAPTCPASNRSISKSSLDIHPSAKLSLTPQSRPLLSSSPSIVTAAHTQSLNNKQSKSTNDLSQLHLNVHKPLSNCLSKSTNRLTAINFKSKDCELSQRKTIYQNLCDKFESACLSEMSPRVSKMYPKISEHDRKILQRMAMKRTEEIAQSEDAVLARKHWEQEKYERDTLLTIQSLEFGHVLREKRHLEKAMRHNRLKHLSQRQKNYAEKIRNEIAAKNLKLMHRMKHIEIQKEVMQCQRRQDFIRKFELATMAQEENKVDEAIRKQECHANLEHRISRAHDMRNYLIGAYQRRVYEDNEKQQQSHAFNYDEVKRMDKLNHEMLKERLEQRNRKSTQFIIEKQRWVEESRDQARVTAELRDIVRRSISPDNYSYRNTISNSRAADNIRPISNLSLYDSHLKLS